MNEITESGAQLMVILIEGNEGTGKTTLINELLKKMNACSIKISRRFSNLCELYEELTESPQLYIFDRGFITDLVYRCLDGETGDLPLSYIGRLCRERSRNIKIVFCNNEKAFENAIKRGEDNVTIKSEHERIELGFAYFEQMMKSFTNIETFDYNYEYQSVDDVIEFIKGRCQG